MNNYLQVKSQLVNELNATQSAIEQINQQLIMSGGNQYVANNLQQAKAGHEQKLRSLMQQYNMVEQALNGNVQNAQMMNNFNNQNNFAGVTGFNNTASFQNNNQNMFTGVDFRNSGGNLFQSGNVDPGLFDPTIREVGDRYAGKNTQRNNREFIPQHNTVQQPTQQVQQVAQKPVVLIPIKGSEVEPFVSTGVVAYKETQNGFYQWKLNGKEYDMNKIINLTNSTAEALIDVRASGSMCSHEKLAFFEFKSIEKEADTIVYDVVNVNEVIVGAETPDDIFVSTIKSSKRLDTLVTHIMKTQNEKFIAAMDGYLTAKVNEYLEFFVVDPKETKIDSFLEDIKDLIEIYNTKEDMEIKLKFAEAMKAIYESLQNDIKSLSDECSVVCFSGAKCKTTKFIEKTTLIYSADEEFRQTLVNNETGVPIKQITKTSSPEVYRMLEEAYSMSANAKLSKKMLLLTSIYYGDSSEYMVFRDTDATFNIRMR